MVETVQNLSEVDIPRDAVVIADEDLPDAGQSAFDPIYVVGGESLKTLTAVEALAGRVLERRSTRPITLVAVGGGSVGDAVGFLASILWRGVELWHVPSTLLAMVDSAHGGKTAVNLGSAKNQLGTFYPASKVVLVEEFLETLPLPQRRDGLAELVKGLWLAPDTRRDYDVEALASQPFDQVREQLMGALGEAIRVKLDIVDRDPREERGIRTHLNFGHTVAHALELQVGLSHGHAVAWGMLAATFLSSLDAADAAEFRRQLLPLLTPRATLRVFDDHERFAQLVGRDKKTRHGRLRSVLLDGPGEPYVTEDIDADAWFDALHEAIDFVDSAVIRPRHPGETLSLTPSIAASKSEMNRVLVMAHLAEGVVEIEQDVQTDSDDVDALRRALRQLREVGDEEDVTVTAGEGGTTLRFLLAVAMLRSGCTHIEAAPRLLERPHGPLVDTLRSAGAIIDTNEGGFVVEGVGALPPRLRVDASESSQFASAIALLAAAGERFTLELVGELVSRPYFDLTLSMLRDVGVTVEWRDGAVRLDGSTLLPTTLHPAPDASSAAVWKVAGFIGLPVDTEPLEGAEEQPDADIEPLLAILQNGSSVDIDLSDSPDLAPVLTVAAFTVEAEVRLGGAAHLRVKESDRIGDFVASLRDVGAEVDSREDGILIPAGRQTCFDGTFDTHRDHRLAMAAFLLAALDPQNSIDVVNPHCVSKSYASFWHHVRQLGFRLESNP